MTSQNLHELLKQAEDDYDLMVVAGVNAYETEELFYQALEDQYGVIYSLIEQISGRYSDF